MLSSSRSTRARACSLALYAVGVLATTLAVSCREATSPPPSTEEPTAAETEIGAEGGTVAINAGPAAGALVMVPAGALSERVRISVAPVDASDPLPKGVSANGPLIQLGPERQRFAVPVTLTVPAKEGSTVLMTRGTDDTLWSEVPGATYDGARGVMTAQVSHFSLFVAATGTPEGIRFRALPEATACFSGSSPLLADFNGDGRLDVAIGCNYQDYRILLFPGKGDGTLGPGNRVATALISGMVTADFNDDGKADLAYTDSVNGYVAALLGNGSGDFTTAGALFLRGPVSPVPGDFNGDGRVDLVVIASRDDTGYLLLGNGDGSFTQGVSFTGGTGLGSPVVGDFNGDGKLDVATSSSGSNTLNVFLGKGDGTLQAAQHSPAGGAPSRLVAEDFNGDGRLDVACTLSASSNLSVLLGTGTGTFEAPTVVASISGLVRLLAGDFNGDGRPDLIGAATHRQIIGLAGDGAGGMVLAPSASMVSMSASGMSSGDLNGDGKRDVVALLSSSVSVADRIAVLLNAIAPPATP